MSRDIRVVERMDGDTKRWAVVKNNEEFPHSESVIVWADSCDGALVELARMYEKRRALNEIGVL